jgi:hypothetical protein
MRVQCFWRPHVAVLIAALLTWHRDAKEVEGRQGPCGFSGCFDELFSKQLDTKSGKGEGGDPHVP